MRLALMRPRRSDVPLSDLTPEYAVGKVLNQIYEKEFVIISEWPSWKSSA
jgi:hypothetical protein